MTENIRDLTLLIVEDQLLISRYLSSEISSSFPSLRIQTARNGQDAYQKIRNEGLRPDIMITDVQMPTMGGDQFLEKLVQDGTQIPTIVMSSELDNENSARAVYYSHRMYTPKQIGILQLQQHIQPSVNEQITYTNQQMEKYRTDYIRARRERRVLNIKDYLGFTAIQKPIDENDILERIRIIQRRLYENNQQ